MHWSFFYIHPTQVVLFYSYFPPGFLPGGFASLQRCSACFDMPSNPKIMFSRVCPILPKSQKSWKGPSVTTSRSPGRADPSFLAIKPLGTLPAAGHVLAKIPFYTGFTKRGGPPGKKPLLAKIMIFMIFTCHYSDMHDARASWQRAGVRQKEKIFRGVKFSFGRRQEGMKMSRRLDLG